MPSEPFSDGILFFKTFPNKKPSINKSPLYPLSGLSYTAKPVLPIQKAV